MNLRSKQLACALVLGTACGGDDGDTNADDGTTSGSESGSESTMGLPTSDPDSGPSSGVDPTVTTVTDADSGSTETTVSTTDPDASSGPGGSDTAAGNVCEPAATDDECYACQKENCCNAMTMCVEAEPNCACVLDCMGALDDPGPAEAQTCADECDADFDPLAPSLIMLAQCRGEMCGGGNGCGGN
jgi:hypothetical protein